MQQKDTQQVKDNFIIHLKLPIKQMYIFELEKTSNANIDRRNNPDYFVDHWTK